MISSEIASSCSYSKVMNVHSDAVLRNHNNKIVDAGRELSKRFSRCRAVIQCNEMGRLVVSNRCLQQQ